jgi:hypothetical protein
MKTELKYVELITNYNHNGPAWIGQIAFSKSGKTLYFNGKAFQRIGSSRTTGNFYDIETMEEYWISGVKKDMSDRHQFGSGKIYVEERILPDYLKLLKLESLDNKDYEMCQLIEDLPIERINEMENQLNKFGTK